MAPRPVRKWIAAGVLASLIGAVGVFLAAPGRDPWPVVTSLTPPAPGFPVGWTDDGRLLTSNYGKFLAATDLQTGRSSAFVDDPLILEKSFDRDHRHFLATSFASDDHRAIVWGDAASGVILQRFSVPTQVFHPVLEPGEQSIRAFARDAHPPHRLREVVTWDIASGAETRQPITGPAWTSPNLHSEAVSRDGRMLAYVDRSRHGVLLWDTATDRPIGELFAASSTPLTDLSPATFTPDGRQIILSRTDGGFEVWDVGGWLVRRFVVHSGGFATQTLEVAPDGRTLAAGGFVRGRASWRDRAARWVRSFFPTWQRQVSSEVVVVDLATGRRLARSRGSMFPLFTPDGQQIATHEADGTCALRAVPRRDDR